MSERTRINPRATARLLPTTLLVLVMIAFALPASASAAAIVKVTPIQGPTKDVDLASLSGEEDVKNVGYAIRSSSGNRTETISGFSLEKILIAGGADVFTFNYVEIVRPGGGSVLLTQSQVRDEGAFPDGQPAVFESGGDAGFVRPSSGPGDYNSADFFSASPLKVILHKGQLIELEATASKSKAKTGEKIKFSVEIVRQASGSSPTIRWSFGDGSSKLGATVTHTFKRPGQYNVAVGATTDDDRTGGSDLVRVQIGEPRKGGPDRDGGGKDKGKNASDSGASDGTGGVENGTGDLGSTGNTPSTSDTTVNVPSDRKKDDLESRDDASGERVEGELLSGADLKNAEVLEGAPEKREEEPPAPTLRTGTPTDQSGFTIPGAALAGVGAIGLLGLGALIEMGALAGTREAVRRRLSWIRAKMKL